MKYYNTVKTFLTKGLWNVDVKKLPRLKRFGYSFLRVLIIAIRGFQEDHCTLQASALTYITLVSLVPILAITLAFCKGIGLQRKLIETIGLERSVQIVRDDNGRIRREISYRVLAADPEQEDGLKTGAAMDAQGNAETPDAPVIVIADPGASDATIVAAIETESPAAEGIAATEEEASRGIDNPEFPGNASQEPTPVPFHRHPHYAAQLPEAMQTALVSIFTYVDKTNFAALGLIGIAALLFSVLSAIRKLEDNFNAIWCVKKGRNLLQQFSQYLIVLLLFPIVTLLAISASAFAHSGGLAEMLHSSSPIVIMLGHYGGNLLMFLFLLGGFVFLYFFMPNTRVRLAPAFFGGLLGSLAWLGVLYVYLRWQVGLAKFNAIYGGFAALPFFLAWLYTSWIVVLLGAEFTYAVENIRLTRLTKHLPPPDPATNHLLGIAAMESICRHFDDGQGPWNAATYAANHAIALNELIAALDILTRSNLIIQLTPDADPPAKHNYIPIRPPAQITLAEVQEAFFGMEAGRAQEISQLLPERLITSLQNYHHENIRELSEINFGK